MGRIRTQLIKRITRELLEKHRDKFSTDFEKNKGVLNKVSKTFKALKLTQAIESI